MSFLTAAIIIGVVFSILMFISLLRNNENYNVLTGWIIIGTIIDYVSIAIYKGIRYGWKSFFITTLILIAIFYGISILAGICLGLLFDQNKETVPPSESNTTPSDNLGAMDNRGDDADENEQELNYEDDDDFKIEEKSVGNNRVSNSQHSATGNLKELLKTIVSSKGIEWVRDGRKTLSMLMDLAPDLKREHKMFSYFIQSGGIELLLNVLRASRTEQRICRHRVIHNMVESQLIKEDVAIEVCDAFWIAIGGEPFDE